uniref:Uncharacterized protein n=1 Tax=Quercus lobata TaxID=97700 RepID=A0A7N2LYW4_QUELO
MEDITKGWNQLSLSDQEGSGFHLRKELASEEFILTAKFVSREVAKGIYSNIGKVCESDGLKRDGGDFIQHYYHHNQPQKNFSAIHIDELFDEPVSVYTKNMHAHAETSKGKKVFNEKVLPTNTNNINSVEDAWKVVVASSPHLQVDERAEEFISKFHEEMKLQKERSNLEFQEMLARSA